MTGSVEDVARNQKWTPIKKNSFVRQFKAMCSECAAASTLGKSRPRFLFPLMSLFVEKFFSLTSLSNRLLHNRFFSFTFASNFRQTLSTERTSKVHFGFCACDRVQVFHFFTAQFFRSRRLFFSSFDAKLTFFCDFKSLKHNFSHLITQFNMLATY